MWNKNLNGTRAVLAGCTLCFLYPAPPAPLPRWKISILFIRVWNYLERHVQPRLFPACLSVWIENSPLIIQYWNIVESLFWFKNLCYFKRKN